MPDPTAAADGGDHATRSHGYDEGRRHGHKEARDEIMRVRAEIARPRALLAAAGVDPGEPEGGKP